jgi:hypothetical protein
MNFMTREILQAIIEKNKTDKSEGFRGKRLMSGRGNVRLDKKNEDGLTFSLGEKHIEEIFGSEKLYWEDTFA